MDLNSDPPAYEAVSYSWRRDVLLTPFIRKLAWFLPGLFPKEYSVEDSSLSRLLICNGKILKIQPNLYDFLLRLRRERRGLPLWIDAICINQDLTDKQACEEKYGQICMMHRIYESAARVLVWLGESTNLSKNLSDIMEEIEIPYQGTRYYEGFREENHISKRSIPKLSFPEVLIKALGLEGSFWSIVRNFYRRSTPLADLSKLANRDYFQRVWVVQELVLARELHFFAGSLQLSWETILKGYNIVSTFRTQPTMGLSDLRSPGFLVLPHILKAREDRQQKEGEGYSWSLDDFLFLLRDRVATNPEDKIFSIRGLVDSEVTDEVTADVGRDGSVKLETLYLNCAVAIARERDWPYVLSLVGMGSTECSDLPSWVPDFRKPLRPKPFWYFGSSSTQRPTPGIVMPGDFSVSDLGNKPAADGAASNSSHCWALEVPLAMFDVIVQVGESDSELDELLSPRMQGHIFDLLTQLGRRYRPTGELTLDALFRTLTADVFALDPARSMTRLRMEFYIWLGVTFCLVETPRIPGADWVSDKLAEQSGLDIRRDTPAINGQDVDLKTCIDKFVEMHDTSVYHAATIFNREASSRGWIPEEPSEESLEQLRDSTGVFEPLWEGPFTVAKLVDGAIRRANATTKDVKNAIDRVYKDRRVFRTRKGYLGSGPRDIRLGDVVCIVAGSSTPFLFRRVEQEGGEGLVAGHMPSAEELGKVRAVGEAYVHGVMDGTLAETLRGSFAGVKVV